MGFVQVYWVKCDFMGKETLREFPREILRLQRKIGNLIKIWNFLGNLMNFSANLKSIC
jgi:hypothetical protein